MLVGEWKAVQTAVLLLLSLTSFVAANAEVTVVDGWCDASVSACFNNSTWETEEVVTLISNSHDTFYVELPLLPSKKRFLTRVCWSATAGASVDIGDLHGEGEQKKLQIEVTHEGVTTGKSHTTSVVEVVLRVALETVEIVPVQTALLGVYATAVGVVAALFAWRVI